MKRTSTPKADGFFMPAEFAPKSQVFIAWPERSDNWRQSARPAQKQFASLAEKISHVAQVTLFVRPAHYDSAKKTVNQNINVVKMEYNDAWMRDIGATAVVNDSKEVRLVNWIFNAWGGLVDGLYSPWDHDDRVGENMAHLLALDYYNAPFILEGGSIYSDGEGTLYTTEECLLSAGRNPNRSKNEMEDLLCQYLNIEKVIWLAQGLYNDETNGHIDNIIKLVAPSEVLLTYCNDPNDPQYEISQQALEILNTSKDAKGRSIKVNHLPMPGPLYLSAKEACGITPSSTMKRSAGERLSASYTNALILNKRIFMPLLDPQTDIQAQKIFEQALSDHIVVPIESREILIGGGNIHCITQTIP